MTKDELLALLRANGCPITAPIEDAAEDLADLCTAEAKGLDDVTHVLAWLKEKWEKYGAEVTEVGINNLSGWHVDESTGNITHETGKFFSVIGVEVSGATGREVSNWSQPLLKQEECGILGVIRQKKDGVMRYLLCAKFEPGRADFQLAPTLQATESNLLRSHGGKKPLFAEYFEDGGKGKVLVNVTHVEDPSRFYRKTNRCMMIEIPEEESVAVPDDFLWLTLPQVKKLLKIDNVVNALTRSVFGSR